MENWWFRYYLESDIVKSASYLFTLNRIIKPKYDPESKDDPISILDFNLDNYEKIHFDICALYKLSYETEKIFGIPIFSNIIRDFLFISSKLEIWSQKTLVKDEYVLSILLTKLEPSHKIHLS